MNPQRQAIKVFLVLFCLLVLLTTSVTAESVPLDTLVLGYDYEGTSISGTTLSSVVGSNDGTIRSGTIQNKTGFIGQAFNHTGVTTCHGITSIGYTLPSAHTVSAWIRPDQVTGGFVSLYGENSGDWFHWKDSDNKMGVYDGTYYSVNIGELLMDTWAMVTMSYNNTHLLTYHNGTYKGAIAAAGKSWTLADTACVYVSDYFYSGLMDEFYVWNETLNSSQITALFQAEINGSSYPFTLLSSVAGVAVSPSSPDVNTTYLNCTYTFTNHNGGSSSDNSVIQWNMPSSKLNVSANETTILGNTNYTYDDSITCTVHPYDGNYTGTAVTSSNVSIGLFDESTFGLPELILDDSTQSFNFSANFTGGAVLSVNSALFQFNNTNYTATATLYNNNITAIVSGVSVPDLTAQTDIEYFWAFNVTNILGNSSHSFENNATISVFDMNNCSTDAYNYSVVGINFTTRHEITNLLVNTTLDTWLNVTWPGVTGYLAFNISHGSDTSHSFCFNPNNANVTVYAQSEYGASGFATKTYYLTGFNMDNVTNNITLYVTNGTSQVTFTVVDTNDEPVANAKIKVLSYDLGTDSYTTTEILNTDSSGEAFGQIILNTAWYAFIIEVNNEVKLQTIPTKITSTSRTFRIDLTTDYFLNYNKVLDVAHNLSFNNATLTFRFTYSDTTGSVRRGCILVEEIGMNGRRTECHSCALSAAATILCPINTTVGSQTFTATSRVWIDEEEYFLETLTKSFGQFYENLGADGLFYSFLMLLFLVMVGLWLPQVSIGLALFSLVMLNVMGIHHFNWGAIVGLIVCGVMFMYRLSKE